MKSEHTALIGRNHILNVDIGVLPAMLLQDLKSVLYQFSNPRVIPLSIIYFITNVHFIQIMINSKGSKGGLHVFRLKRLNMGRICL